MYQQLQSLLAEQLCHTQTASGKQAAFCTQQYVVARQPIFDTNGGVWGYELLYRQPRHDSTDNSLNGTIATASVVVNGFDVVRPGIRDNQKLLINFPASLIETQILRLLPAETCVAEILEDVEPSPAILAAITEMKAAGYTIALDDYTGQKELEPFLPLVDIVKIDVLGMPAKELMMLASRARLYRCTLLAEKVEDRETADLCRRLGFSLFQGYFFSRPELVEGRQTDGSQVARMRILALSVNEDTSLTDISEAVLHDPLITAKFLKFVNSAYFGLPHKVLTVNRALALIGRLTFTQWLCVNALATMNNNAMSQEVAFLAAQRAKFLETLALTLRKQGKLAPDIISYDLFLAGLFSLFESFLAVPLDAILEGIPLHSDVVAALSGEASPYVRWLELARYYEHGDWEHCLPIAASLGLDETGLTAAYADALQWSSAFYDGPETSETPARASQKQEGNIVGR